MDAETSITVLIPSKGRPADLARCVQSVLASDHPSFEVIVIEQGGACSWIPDDDRVRHFVSPTVGKSAALNEGLGHARGALLAFTDDDCTVPPGWLRNGEALLLAHPEVGMVFGRLQAIEHDPSSAFIPEFNPDQFAVLRGRSSSVLRGGAGANMFIRREVFAAIDGFDSRIGPGAHFPSCEEFDLYYRVLGAGIAVARDPDNAVLHWGLRSYGDGSGQRLLRGYYLGEGVVLGKHVRCGDGQALVVAGKIAVEQLKMIGQSIAARRLTGLGRAAYWVRGFGAGLTTRVDRTNHLFVE